MGVETAFLGFGPRPRPEAEAEAMRIGPLDWSDAAARLDGRRRPGAGGVPEIIAGAARRARADIVQVNVPSQAAGLPPDVPVVAVHHSCVSTWFRAVRGASLPEEWAWQAALTQGGSTGPRRSWRPPSRMGGRSRRSSARAAFGVVPNGVEAGECELAGGAYIAASGRWWDEGKGGATLDAAAEATLWPVVMAGPVRARAARSRRRATPRARAPCPTRRPRR
jgi:hypothetical protein